MSASSTALEALAPSGEQIPLRSGRATATIATVGATIRTFAVDGRDIFVAFEEREPAPRFHGATLAPWPNRITDGRYAFDGLEHRLPITEVDRHHALHGLACWLDFDVAERRDDGVLLTATIVAQPGYPWTVDLAVEHRLDDAGLTTTVTATNRGLSPAPFGTGSHPWIAIADGLEGATLSCPADLALETVGDRMLPGALGEPRDELDFRSPRAIGATAIDHAFGALRRDGDDVCVVAVVGADGVGARLVVDATVPWVQVCTDDLPGPASRRSIAIEPMTCPPDAFATGDDVARIEPGATRCWSWRYEAITPGDAP